MIYLAAISFVAGLGLLASSFAMAIKQDTPDPSREPRLSRYFWGMGIGMALICISVIMVISLRVS